MARLIDVARVKEDKVEAGRVYAVLPDGTYHHCASATQLMFYRRLTTKFVGDKGFPIPLSDINANLREEIGYYV